jgi:hypothetical protein
MGLYPEIKILGLGKVETGGGVSPELGLYRYGLTGARQFFWQKLEEIRNIKNE